MNHIFTWWRPKAHYLSNHTAAEWLLFILVIIKFCVPKVSGHLRDKFICIIYQWKYSKHALLLFFLTFYKSKNPKKKQKTFTQIYV